MSILHVDEAANIKRLDNIRRKATTKSESNLKLIRLISYIILTINNRKINQAKGREM